MREGLTCAVVVVVNYDCMIHRQGLSICPIRVSKLLFVVGSTLPPRALITVPPHAVEPQSLCAKFRESGTTNAINPS